MTRLTVHFDDAESGPTGQVYPADALLVNQVALTTEAAAGIEFLALHGGLPEPVAASMLLLVDLMRQGTLATLDAMSGDLEEDEAIARTEEIVRHIAAGTANLEQTKAIHEGGSASH